MKKLLLLALASALVNTVSSAQSVLSKGANSTGSPARSRFQAFRAFVSTKAVYPLIKSSKFSGVVPVNEVDEKPDVNLRYKLLMDVSTGFKDSTSASELNDALAEVARAINTHVAAGVSPKNLEMVVVVHGGALKSFYSNAVYRQKYQVDNANSPLFDELLSPGVRFIACGQSMAFQHITKNQLVPWMKVALSAQIPISTYQLKGFVYKKIETD